jgi:hypothetical protein
MSLPNTKLTVKDFGLGAQSAAGELSAILGCCSLAANNSINALASKDDVAAVLGTGPLASAAVYHLASSNKPVLCVPVNKSVAGTHSAVTRVCTGTAILAVSGTPTDGFDWIVEIIKGGVNLAAAVATFRYSKDGGDTYSAEIAIPVGGVYAVPGTGTTFTFTNGAGPTSFVAGDKFTFSTSQPGFALVDLTAAIDALAADPRIGQCEFIHVVGVSDATIATGIEAKAVELEAAFKYTFFVLEARDQNSGENRATWEAALITAMSALSAPHTLIAAGYAELTDAASGEIKRRSIAWPLCYRIATTELSQNPAEFDGGALPGVVSLAQDEETSGGTLHDQRFATARTFTGQSGFYISAAKLMAPAGSDFAEVMNRRVMNAACRTTRAAMLLELNKRVQVSPSTGKITETEARRIEKNVTAKLKTAIGAQCSDVSAAVDRAENVLSTKKLKVKIAIVPFGYNSAIEVTLGFDNPALQLN